MHQIDLRCGVLSLSVAESAIPLEELCTFGTRRNRRRGFLIISKVLGKHVPVRPAHMARIHRLLAEQVVDVTGPVLVIALAETAIGLGQGVFETLLELTGRSDLLFLHSTRYRLDRPLACAFREEHSHAAEHLLYQPADAEDGRLMAAARTLILIDDEISTGRTLVGLARELAPLCPRLESIRLVSITNWLDDGRQAALQTELPVPPRYHQVLRGRLHFEANSSFDPGPLPNVQGGREMKDRYLHSNHGRLGRRMPVVITEETVATMGGTGSARPGGPAAKRILVLGTGEFVHAPYRFARLLEQRGGDVWFQSTTRSPALVGEGIASALEFIDNYHDGIPNYVYNVADKSYDRIIVGYETAPLPAEHRLLEMLRAESVFF